MGDHPAQGQNDTESNILYYKKNAVAIAFLHVLPIFLKNFRFAAKTFARLYNIESKIQQTGHKMRAKGALRAQHIRGIGKKLQFLTKL